MSGVMDFVRPRRIPQGPIEKKLAVESDQRLYRTVGAGQVAGAWFVAWALTVKLAIPLPPPVDGEPLDEELPPIITFREPIKKLPKPKDPVAKALPRQNTGPKARSSDPVKDGGNLQVNPITSIKDGLYTAGADIIKDVMKNIDLEKIEKVEGLRRTEPTVLAGRRGAKTEGYNEPYADGDGTTSGIDLLPTSRPGRIEPDRAAMDRMVGSTSTITVSSEGRFRSSDEILRVVKAGTPGLRHLYNTHLKANPGLGGKVTIRFAVAPSGLVVDAAIASGTTGAARFEEQVLAKIRTWRFDPIKAVGNDIVTVPFNFSE